MELPAILEFGSFGLVAYLVLQVFRKLEEQMQRQTDAMNKHSRVLAELVLQISEKTSNPTLAVQTARQIMDAEADRISKGN